MQSFKFIKLFCLIAFFIGFPFLRKSKSNSSCIGNITKEKCSVTKKSSCLENDCEKTDKQRNKKTEIKTLFVIKNETVTN